MVAIEAMRPKDWGEVRRIFEEGIASGNATFETQAPDRETWDRAHRVEPRLVAREDGRVLGWAALSPVSMRPVYAGVAEVTSEPLEAVESFVPTNWKPREMP